MITVKKIFYILLNDFISETDTQASTDNITLLNELLKISNNPQFSVKNSERKLKTSVEVFSTWLLEEINVCIPSINKDVKISISRIDAINICGNLSKHNDLRAFLAVKKFKEIMTKSELLMPGKKYMIALRDFYDKFQDDILIYLSSYICEFLNNIRLAIHGYLLPEFNRSYHELSSDLPSYSYKIQKEIECEYAQYCYWELMNILGRSPLMGKFVISPSFKSEY